MGLSLRPSTFSLGSLLDDIDAEVVRARFVQYDYEGKADNNPTCVLLLLKDGDGNESPQYWSAGDPAYFVPSEDPKNEELNGITLVQVGDKTSLNGGTNAAIMLNSLVQAGFPEDKLDSGDLRVLEGMVAHWNRVPQPKRSNMPTKPGQSDRTPMVLIATQIKALPGEAKPAKAAGKPNGAAGLAKGAGAGKLAATTAAKPAVASPSDAGLVEELQGELIGLFADKGVAEMKKAEIARNLFGTIDKANPNRNKLISMAAKDDVLKTLDGFSYNGSVLSQA
jgi:hypothetical protein